MCTCHSHNDLERLAQPVVDKGRMKVNFEKLVSVISFVQYGLTYTGAKHAIFEDELSYNIRNNEWHGKEEFDGEFHGGEDFARFLLRQFVAVKIVEVCPKVSYDFDCQEV
jgi:hypothetical protein